MPFQPIHFNLYALSYFTPLSYNSEEYHSLLVLQDLPRICLEPSQLLRLSSVPFWASYGVLAFLHFLRFYYRNPELEPSKTRHILLWKRCNFSKLVSAKRKDNLTLIRAVAFAMPGRGAGAFSFEPPGHFTRSGNRNCPNFTAAHLRSISLQTVMDARPVAIGTPNQTCAFSKAQG